MAKESSDGSDDAIAHPSVGWAILRFTERIAAAWWAIDSKFVPREPRSWLKCNEEFDRTWWNAAGSASAMGNQTSLNERNLPHDSSFTITSEERVSFPDRCNFGILPQHLLW
jgi:hypothetical protein